MNLRASKDYCIRGVGMYHYKIDHLLPSTSMRRVNCSTGITTVPSKATEGLSYVVKSSGLSLYPSYKSGYMISIPLP